MSDIKDLVVGSGPQDVPGVLSFSALNMVDRCPAQYDFRYVRGKVQPPAFALGMGSQFHNAIEEQNRTKMTTGQNLSTEDVLDVLSDSWKRGMDFGGSRDRPSYISWKEVAKADKSAKINPKQAREITEAATVKYHTAKATKLKPIAVEAQVFTPLVDDKAIIGYIDVVHQHGSKRVAADMKLTGKRYDAKAADQSMQLASYSWSQVAAGGQPFHEVAFHVTTKTKVPEVQVLQTRMTPERMQAFLAWAMAMVAIIERGEFVGRVGYHCNWCGYKEECPWYNGRGFGAIGGDYQAKAASITYERRPIEFAKPAPAPAKKKTTQKKSKRKSTRRR